MRVDGEEIMPKGEGIHQGPWRSGLETHPLPSYVTLGIVIRRVNRHWVKIKKILDYRELILNLVIRDLKVKYKGSVLGFFWSLLNPLLLLVVYSIAFKYVIRIRVENFPLFFMVAFLPWTFLTLSLSLSVNVIVDNRYLIKKVYFPREILPLSVVLFNLVQFLLTFLILFPVLFLFRVPLGPSLGGLPLVIGLQTLFITGIALVLSNLNVYFRDIKHLVEVFLQMWFWLTPVAYPFTLVPDPVKFLFKLNPMTLFVIAYRDILLEARFPDMALMGQLALWSLGVLVLGYLLFNRYDARLAESI